MRRLLLMLLILLVVAGAWLLNTLRLGGYWRDLTPHFAGTCRQVEGLPGPEDITIHPRTGIAYVSSVDRRAVRAGRPGYGGIFAYDLRREAPVPHLLTPDADPEFHPHGISLLVGADGRDRLYAVNHAGGRHTIEEYEVGADRLTHLRTLSDPLLRSPNDLVALAPDLLYVTNDHGWPKGFLSTLEEWFRIPVSDVVVFDGRGFRVAARRINLANGINKSADGTTLYVASPTGLEIRVYDREADGGLRLRQRIPLGTAPDNIEVAEDGSLWVGAHPNLFALAAHMGGAPEHSPSHVVRAIPEADGGFAVDEVLLEAGDRLCASSVAAVRGKRLLVGGVFEPRVLDCTLD